MSEPFELTMAIDETKASLQALDALKSDGISGRSLSIAYTKLQEALMWLNKYRFQDLNNLPERHNL